MREAKLDMQAYHICFFFFENRHFIFVSMPCFFLKFYFAKLYVLLQVSMNFYVETDVDDSLFIFRLFLYLVLAWHSSACTLNHLGYLS